MRSSTEPSAFPKRQVQRKTLLECMGKTRKCGATLGKVGLNGEKRGETGQQRESPVTTGPKRSDSGKTG